MYTFFNKMSFISQIYVTWFAKYICFSKSMQKILIPTQKNSASWDLQLGFNLAFKRLSGEMLCVVWGMPVFHGSFPVSVFYVFLCSDCLVKFSCLVYTLAFTFAGWILRMSHL